MKAVGAVIGVLVVVLGLTWLFQGNDFFMYKVFAPKYEQVRHDTFKESQTYNDGMVGELQKMRADYFAAQTDGQRDALASAILWRVNTYDVDRLPRDLRSFVVQLRNDRQK